ncbi:MAG TPA: hypothetical protein VF772_24795 [Terriglobales bacterium]
MRGILNESPQLVSDLFDLVTALRGGVRRRTNTFVERAAASCQCRRHWVIQAKNWNGVLNTKTVDLEQNGNSITGHFKGPNQSGGIEGSVNGHHIVFRTKTKHPLTFRGQADGDTIAGIYHLMGKEGEFHAERTASK